MPPIEEANSVNNETVNGEVSINEDNSIKENTLKQDENSENQENSNQDSNEIKEEVFESAKDSTAGKFDTLALIQEVGKLEASIDLKSKQKPNEATFYSNIKKYLTDDQMQLRFEDDQSKYIEAVNEAKEKWLSENSIDTQEEEKALAVAQGNLLLAKAIDTVLKDPNYKDFNFVKLQDFYHNDLTKKEQAELDKGSTKENLDLYFKKIHDEYKKRNPKNVKNVKAPNIPDTSNVSKGSVEDKKEIQSEQDKKKYMHKIGFRKL